MGSTPPRRGWMMIGSGVGVVALGAALAAASRAIFAPPVHLPEARPSDPVMLHSPPATVALDVGELPVREPWHASATAPSQKPDQLERAEILAAMDRVKPRVEKCVAKFHQPGVAMVKLNVIATGRVTAAHVTGALEDTPISECIEKAARTASFRSFKRPSLTLTWPFILKE